MVPGVQLGPVPLAYTEYAAVVFMKSRTELDMQA